MRGTVPGLPTRLPLGPALPGLLQDDDLVQRMMAAFDEVLAPVIGVLDDLDAYLAPALAPPDFLAWLGSWLGVEVVDGWPIERRREAVRRASELQAVRGTPGGVAELVALLTDDDVEVEDSGGVSVSAVPGEPLVEVESSPWVRVTVGPDVDVEALRASVVAACPAHVTVHLRRRSRRSKGVG